MADATRVRYGDWQQVSDGLYCYYWNVVTNETRWDCPGAPAPAQASAAESSHAAAVSSSKAASGSGTREAEHAPSAADSLSRAPADGQIDQKILLLCVLVRLRT